MMDLTSRKAIRDISKKFGFTFFKGFGQNFLLDKSVVELAAEAAEVEDGVIEIGPGFGVLTYELAKRSQKVVSLEIDKRLMPVLEYTLAEFDNVKIVNQDVLKTNLKNAIDIEFGGKRVSIAANLPYYITTPILCYILESRLPLKNIVVMVQKEVAERICALPGTKSYSALTVMCRYYSDPEIIANVPSNSFMPEPGVDSALVRLKIKKEPNVSVKDEELFFATVKAAFSQRRKTLENCLAQGFVVEKIKIAKVLSECMFAPKIRGEQLSVEDFALLSDKLSNVVVRNVDNTAKTKRDKRKLEKNDWEETFVDENGKMKLTVGEKMYISRKINRYSRKKFADMSNVSQSSIMRIEHNITKAMQKNIDKMAPKVNLTIDILLKRSEQYDVRELRKTMFPDSETCSEMYEEKEKE